MPQDSWLGLHPWLLRGHHRQQRGTLPSRGKQSNAVYQALQHPGHAHHLLAEQCVLKWATPQGAALTDDLFTVTGFMVGKKYEEVRDPKGLYV